MSKTTTDTTTKVGKYTALVDGMYTNKINRKIMKKRIKGEFI